MSQWGARGLATRGHNYQQILAHYYQGTALSNIQVAGLQKQDLPLLLDPKVLQPALAR
jgi:stage II sporulation protein D